MRRWFQAWVLAFTVFILAACGSVQGQVSELPAGEPAQMQGQASGLPDEEPVGIQEEADLLSGEQEKADIPTGEQGKADVLTGESQETEDTDRAGKVEAEPPEPAEKSGEESGTGTALEEDGVYTTKEDVALYLHLYGHLPDNFITKKEAQALGWEGGSLEPYAPGKCIGGSRFGNYEELLPEKDGRVYTECDIDTLGADRRGAKRIVFSSDGLIYYTEDHYESFELLYGEEE